MRALLLTVVFFALLSLQTSCAGPTYREPENALGPYSASVDYGGLTFVAGKIGSERGDVEFAVEAASAIDNVEAELRRAGLEVQTIEPGPLLNAPRLEAILEKRIEWARRGPGPLPSVQRSTIEHLIERLGDDVRAMEGELYELFQNLDGITNV